MESQPMSDFKRTIQSRIQTEIERVAELICTDQDAAKAYRRLERLTCILIEEECTYDSENRPDFC
jgi:hypothetical protein